MTTIERAGPGSAVRPAVQADLLDVYRIERLVFEQPWPFAAFERYLDEPGFLVHERRRPATLDESAILGYVVADAVPNHVRPLGHVKDLAVHPDAQGRGIGHDLLARALAVLVSQGVRSVKLEVRPSNEAAISLYRDFDFEVLRTLPGYYEDGENAYVMVAHLEHRDP